MKKIFIAAMALYFTACSMPSMQQCRRQLLSNYQSDTKLHDGKIPLPPVK
jgi:hypothetical protein